ncbi:MAG: hypothetical protein DHS20C18_01200 [Saprospiraceae bacterium]|nr:MAG: hypothetical protein DHS20C18_01200 [Saprospiraceae bacterium]
MSISKNKLELNARRFSGEDYTHLYDQSRPAPPDAILHQTLNYLNKKRASTVLDLGCGTGISTLVWQPYAEQITGVEPSGEMLAIARKKVNKNSEVAFIEAFANKVPLPDASIDLVTCSQSFHWMEPESTLAEIDRLLVNNGVLCIYDVEWPPLVNREFEMAYQALFEKVDQITRSLDKKIAHKWRKDQHLRNVQKSKVFRYVREACFHKKEKVNKEVLAGIALSQGGLEALLKRGFLAEEIGLTDFLAKLKNMNPLIYEEITYSYKAIFALK